MLKLDSNEDHQDSVSRLMTQGIASSNPSSLMFEHKVTTVLNRSARQELKSRGMRSGSPEGDRKWCRASGSVWVQIAVPGTFPRV
jgi:hypothetical protein